MTTPAHHEVRGEDPSTGSRATSGRSRGSGAPCAEALSTTSAPRSGTIDPPRRSACRPRDSMKPARATTVRVGHLEAGRVVALHEPLVAAELRKTAARPRRPPLDSATVMSGLGTMSSVVELHLLQCRAGAQPEDEEETRCTSEGSVGREGDDLVMVGLAPIFSWSAMLYSGRRLRDQPQRSARAGCQRRSAPPPATSVTRNSTARCHEAPDRRPPHTCREPVHDLDAGEGASVDGAVVGLARERLMWIAAVRMAGQKKQPLAPSSSSNGREPPFDEASTPSS